MNKPIQPEDLYFCPSIPIFTTRFGKSKPNFIPPEYKIRAQTIRKGSMVKLEEGRRRIVEGKIYSMPEGPLRAVLVIDDYRYPGQFDRFAFFTSPPSIPHCLPITAKSTMIYARTADGRNRISEMKVIKR